MSVERCKYKLLETRRNASRSSELHPSNGRCLGPSDEGEKNVPLEQMALNKSRHMVVVVVVVLVMLMMMMMAIFEPKH